MNEQPQLTSRQVASELGTESKILRRFLRADPTYNNPGSGGRYTFVATDLPTLRKRFQKWAEGQTTAPKATSVTTPDEAVVTPPKSTRGGKRVKSDTPKEWPEAELVYDGPPIPTRLSDKDRARANRRIDRLEARLKAAGLHISQMAPGDLIDR
jgi:hypothetical protein